MPMPLLITTLPGHVALTPGILLRGLMTGRLGDAAKVLADALRGLGLLLDDRSIVQDHRAASLEDLSLAMVWNPLSMLADASLSNLDSRTDQCG